ncbi:MAG: metallophosphoesterase [Ignavibacteria bacterium]|nr:metallophosphoesterase [Ignavibacteria bacterium]
MKVYFLVCVIMVSVSPDYFASTASASDTIRFICNELLCRPTAGSITINACTNKAVEYFYEYGTDSINYLHQTIAKVSSDSIPFTIKIDDLKANTKYFYRMKYRVPGSSTFLARYSHWFQTQRPSGTSFTFAVEADPHMDTNSLAAVYVQTLQNMLVKQPDFLIDLGDTFMSEKLPVITQNEIVKRHFLLRSFFDITCHSVPLFLVQGNHDGELGWRLDTTANNLPVWETNIRKNYYPNPQPDGFYSGNSIAEPYVGLRENYYSWQWGNALFVVIDPYWYTKTKPAWGWTLGADQYNWLKNVLSTSTAKFKFIFCHQLVGGNGNDGRGGSEFVDFYEMGGLNTDSTWGFSSFRQGWEKPIHQLLKQYDVQIYFHGHDHFYGKQDKDGIVYQEVPQPSLKSYTNLNATQYGYVNGVILPSRGYLLVSITDSTAKVEYYRTFLSSEENATRHNGDISHSYTIYRGMGANVSHEAILDNRQFELSQNYPNPFNPQTNIECTLPVRGNLTLTVFDALGREVSHLMDGEHPAGHYKIIFNANTLSLPSGIYYYRLTAGQYSKTCKMIYLK